MTGGLSLFHSTNPATGVRFASYPVIDDAALEATLAAAALATAEWRRSPIATRSTVLRAIAAELRVERATLAALMTAEMGKTRVSAEAEVEKCATNCDFYAEHGPGYLAETRIDMPQGKARIRILPLGLILAVMPWNFPLWQAFRFIAPAIMAGNGILLKHAPNVPQCALAIERIVRAAGAPAMFNLFVDVPAIETIIADDRVAALTLTGSERAGQAVAEAAGRALKKCVLELGGSDPFIVLPSADLGKAVAAAVTGRMQNNGQSCVCSKRFIIHEALYEDFAARFTARATGMVVGDPMQEATELGPLCTASARARLHDQVQQALAVGGRLLAGGEKPDGPGYFYPPTVIADVPPDAPIAREEFFGPVALLFRVADQAAALALANDIPFGLGSSVWTQDAAQAEFFVENLECGITAINSIVVSDPRTPFGGVKRSGYGRELADLGLREFVNVKTVLGHS